MTETRPSPWFAPTILAEADAIIARGEAPFYTCYVSWWFLKMLKWHYRTFPVPDRPDSHRGLSPIWGRTDLIEVRVRRWWVFGRYEFIRKGPYHPNCRSAVVPVSE